MKRLRACVKFFFITHKWKSIGVITLFLIWYAFCLPRPLFDVPFSLVLEDRNGGLLGAQIAGDGQWRFPQSDSLPTTFIQAITEFEDRRFFKHPGVDPIGIGRAIEQNIRNGAIVSGGSTITMQVIRMARGNKPRTLWQKIVEAVLATRLELKFSKIEILKLYSSHAPFGGNVVGIDAASWRYFGKSTSLLSWAEAATLAVLPNAPALIHPGRNRTELLEKRNRLLDRLLEHERIDSLTWELALLEPLPDKPHPLPRLAPHLLDKSKADSPTNLRAKIKTTINPALQEQSQHVLDRHHESLAGNGIHNLAAIIVDIESGEILVYIGNIYDQPGSEHGHEVDIIQAPRSTGSIIKPLLYGMALDEGLILPNTLLPDIPTFLGSYRPENYYESYDGVVPASKAISRSLNVPIIHLLRDYGLEKFHFGLQRIGLSTIIFPPDYYGLPLVLGGAEVTLWDITNAYTCMARTLNQFTAESSRYPSDAFRDLTYLKPGNPKEKKKRKLLKEAPVMGAGAIWHTFEAMKQVERPDQEGRWENYASGKQIAWKTGTSFGFRDAWAVGLNKRYAIGVWAGNADGEGRPGLIGIRAAAPVLFDLFSLLPDAPWFDPPYDDMTQMAVCAKSGYLAGRFCEPVDTSWIPERGTKTAPCPFHERIFTDENENYQLALDCASSSELIPRNCFSLPPVQAHYYKKVSTDYKDKPPYREDCKGRSDEGSIIQVAYPRPGSRIYIPRDIDGQNSRTVFQATHRDEKAIIHWHLDRAYYGSTENFHEMEFFPEPGPHVLVLVDQDGRRSEQRFEVLAKPE